MPVSDPAQQSRWSKPHGLNPARRCPFRNPRTWYPSLGYYTYLGRYDPAIETMTDLSDKWRLPSVQPPHTLQCHHTPSDHNYLSHSVDRRNKQLTSSRTSFIDGQSADISGISIDIRLPFQFLAPPCGLLSPTCVPCGFQSSLLSQRGAALDAHDSRTRFSLCKLRHLGLCCTPVCSCIVDGIPKVRQSRIQLSFESDQLNIVAIRNQRLPFTCGLKRK